MKIRTFISCEEIKVNVDSGELTIKKMFGALSSNTFPYEENIALVFTFDEVETKSKTINVILLGKNDKPMQTWNKQIKESQTSPSMKILKAIFKEPGVYYLKITYNDDEFLGKYPLRIKKSGEK